MDRYTADRMFNDADDREEMAELDREDMDGFTPDFDDMDIDDSEAYDDFAYDQDSDLGYEDMYGGWDEQPYDYWE